MLDNLEPHKTLYECFLLSILILIIILILNHNYPIFLEINYQWIIVSGSPLIIGLIAGGYIKSIKGFGFELDAKISHPVKSLNLPVLVALDHKDKMIKKESVGKLNQFSNDFLKSINIIKVTEKKHGYYDYHALQEYFNRLNNLEYICVFNKKG
jgi:hypothetical protein